MTHRQANIVGFYGIIIPAGLFGAPWNPAIFFWAASFAGMHGAIVYRHWQQKRAIRREGNR